MLSRLLRFLGWTKPRPIPPAEIDNGFRGVMREKVDWRSDMNSMIRTLRPDLSAEFESLYYGHPHEMAVFLDTHFSIAPDGWGVQNIALVPQMFRKRFMKS